MAIELRDTFDPTVYSIQENLFLLEHLGEAPFLALKHIKAERLPEPARDRGTGKIIDKNPIHYPDGVIPASVEPTLRRVYELEQEAAADPSFSWIGIEALKAAIRTYLEQAAKWDKNKNRRGAPRFPSMHSFDMRNRPLRGGPGSDSGKVHTYFDETGERKELTINLFGEEDVWKPEWSAVRQGTDKPKAETGLRVDSVNNRFECLVCGHTEHFKPESRNAYNAARARMGRHLMTAKDEADSHRIVYTTEFGG